MAYNIVTIAERGTEILEPISVRTAQPSAYMEYDDETWECGNCRQLNDPDCEFCTNCGRAKGKSKINPQK
ncbi:MAG: hypothetical protein K2N06_00530 [Oscillospiraceae bacterium]|nr:hypothetical protein [Oscillospiraceae bacterium]